MVTILLWKGWGNDHMISEVHFVFIRTKYKSAHIYVPSLVAYVHTESATIMLLYTTENFLFRRQFLLSAIRFEIIPMCISPQLDSVLSYRDIQ